MFYVCLAFIVFRLLSCSLFCFDLFYNACIQLSIFIMLWHFETYFSGRLLFTSLSDIFNLSLTFTTGISAFDWQPSSQHFHLGLRPYFNRYLTIRVKCEMLAFRAVTRPLFVNGKGFFPTRLFSRISAPIRHHREVLLGITQVVFVVVSLHVNYFVSQRNVTVYHPVTSRTSADSIISCRTIRVHHICFWSMFWSWRMCQPDKKSSFAKPMSILV